MLSKGSILKLPSEAFEKFFYKLNSVVKNIKWIYLEKQPSVMK